MEIRENASQGSKAIRFRRHPGLNLKAAMLGELVSWDNAHEPLLTCDVPPDQLQQFLSKQMQVPKPSRCMAGPLSVESKK